MKGLRVLLTGVIVLTAIAVTPAMGQEPETDSPAAQKYLSDIKLKLERRNVLPAKDSNSRERRHRTARPWPGPDIAYEVQPWSDGVVTASGWCFALDPEFRGLARWVRCADY
jgi:hypothetical protein